MTKFCHVSTNVFLNSKSFHFDAEFCFFVAIFCSHFHITTVCIFSSNTKTSRFLVQSSIHFVYCHSSFTHNVEWKSRVKVTRTSTHYKSFKRSNTHCCVVTFTVFNSTHRSTVTNVADNYICIFWFLSKKNRSTFCCIQERCSVEPIFAGSIFFVPFVWNCIHIIFCRHCLVPCCIHNCSVWNIWHNFLCSFNTHNICRHVQRSKINNTFECFKNFWSNKNRLCKFVSTMKNTVTNCSNF